MSVVTDINIQCYRFIVNKLFVEKRYLVLNQIQDEIV